jgi:hypothetical protein
MNQDNAREARIEALRELLCFERDLSRAREILGAMYAEIEQRSPAQVAKMERERGLA